MSFPAIFGHVSGPAKLILDSGIFLGAITAIALNIVLNREKHAADRRELSPVLPDSTGSSAH
jgi:xanthine/uracil permease